MQTYEHQLSMLHEAGWGDDHLPGVTKTIFTEIKAEDHRQPGGGAAADIATNKSWIAPHCK